MIVGESYNIHWPQRRDWESTAAGAIVSMNARVYIIVDFHARVRWAICNWKWISNREDRQPSRDLLSIICLLGAH